VCAKSRFPDLRPRSAFRPSDVRRVFFYVNKNYSNRVSLPRVTPSATSPSLAPVRPWGGVSSAVTERDPDSWDSGLTLTAHHHDHPPET